VSTGRRSPGGQRHRGSGRPHDHLTDHGWSTLWAYGIRTVIDLRQDQERTREPTSRPPGLTIVRVPLDDPGDTEFWQRWGAGLDCTPLYYRVVPGETIAVDYALSAERLGPVWPVLGFGDQNSLIDALLAAHGTTCTEAVITTLDDLDVHAYLRQAGLSDTQLRSVRARLLSGGDGAIAKQ
jgi:hypothetical protein